MLSQALEVFKKEYKEKGDSLILDEYIPADGTYVIVKPSDNKYVIDELVDIKLDKKTKTIDRAKSKYMEFIYLADYYSKVTDMNKAILTGSGKVIQGNNYLSFIIKKESLTNGKLTNEIIEKYYSLLENPRLKYLAKTKPKALELYESVEKKIGKVDKNRLHNIKEWIKENLFKQFEKIEGKDYLKIFFKYSKEDYIKESERYYIPNIYNSNQYNQKSKGIIYGLPNDNMGLNSKKPYLENKTRKVSVPYLIDQEEVMCQKKFFDYLMNQATAGKINIYLGEKNITNNEFLDEKFSGIFFRIKKGKEVEIQDYDIISNYDPKIKKIFEYKNIIGTDYEKLKVAYERKKTLGEMGNLINEVMFSKFLKSNYFTEPSDISINDSTLKSNLLKCRTALFNWFYKGNYKNIWSLLDKSTLSLVKGSIKNGYFTKAINQFNLRISLREYFKGGEEMADIIFNTKNKLKNKISQKTTQFIEGDKEYFFAVGQLVSFFISRSKGKKKPLSLANPFVNAKKDKVIKEKLKALYKKYNYDIESYNYKFKGLYAMIMSYEVEGKIDEDMIIAGYLHSNLLYEKQENEEE